MAEDALDLARLYLPKYLTPSQKDELYAELRNFPSVSSFYLPPGGPDHELLQGDIWRGFVVVNFATGERRGVSGLLISNSCDVAPDNRRFLPPNAVFSPVIRLERYVEFLSAAGVTQAQIDSTLASVRKQLVSNVFYLPEAPYGPPESIVLFDDIHSHPLPDFIAAERTRQCRLNQVGFYILLLKLSIHFCRFQEGVARFA
jgi:hypothetical protein